MTNKKIYLIFIGFFLAVVFIGLDIKSAFFDAKDNVFQDDLRKAAVIINKKLPRVVNDEMRVDSVTIPAHNTMRYNAAFVNFTKDEIDTVSFRTDVEPGIIEGLKSIDQFKMMKENEVIFEYYYYDKNNDYVMTITIDPPKYN